MSRQRFIPLVAIVFTMACMLAGRAEAQPRPSSALLLPYFEVDLRGSGKTTLFAVGNALDQPVEITIEIRTNWGIVVSTIQERLEAHEIGSFNLRDWVVQGKLPNRTLRTAERDLLKATLAGQRSPQDSLFYGTPVAGNLAVGSVVIRTQPLQPANALWGDFLLVDPGQKVSLGDDLVNIDPAASCPGDGLCEDHALRFVSGAAVDSETEVVIWTDRAVEPSKDPYPESRKVTLDGIAYSEAGQPISDVHLRLLPLQVVTVGSLGLKEPFGWLNVQSEEPTFIGVHFDTSKRDGVALQAFCLPPHLPPGPGIEIEKRTNGQDADLAPGPTIPVGAAVLWEYIVHNTGSVRLTQVTVTDDRGVQVSCPKDVLDPGDSMVCTGNGTAVACQYENVGKVVATPPEGPNISAEDPSHYVGGQSARITLKKATNGQDADTPPGPQIQAGSPVVWTYVVTNTGDAPLSDVKVTDDKGVAVSCPKNSLSAGEAMTCTANGTAALGAYENIGTVTAKSPCNTEVKDSDSSHYTGVGNPGLKIEKLTNGRHDTQGPGASFAVGSPITWSYVVTNTGKVTLSNLKVTDDKVAPITCPKATLQPGESMTCTATGVAAACNYVNTGTAVGTPPNSPELTAQDWGFYFGQPHPAIDVEKFTNGEDADAAPGPGIPVGDPVNWTYVVTNIGDVPLSDVIVTDSKGVAVSCPKKTLQKGESMTCTGHGIANAGPYENLGTVTGVPPCGSAVSDSDPSHYLGTGLPPGLKIEKLTNGQHDTQAPGASIAVGSPVTWSYRVTNSGQVALSNLQVSDDRVGAIACPKTTLQPGESMTCTASGTAAACQYVNTGTAVGTPPNGPNLMVQDWGFYYGQAHPALSLDKLTNGQDGPTFKEGDAVQWTYKVTNTGDVSLAGIVVTDDKGVAVTCPKTSLQQGESMTCTGSGIAIAGSYRNVGTATGNPPCGSPVSASDPSWYTGTSKPAAIDIKKFTNGEDADSAPGPTIAVGAPVHWTYIVTNTGAVALSNVKVTDNRGVAVSCPKTSLQAGESMTCTGNGTATAGQYENIGTTVGTPPSGPNVTDSDPSHYYGQTFTTGQGCTPGYWKTHTDSWPPTGFSPSQKVQSVFAQAANYPSLGSASLLDALSFQGGTTLQGAAEILLRAGVAGLLDSAHPGVDYPRTTASVISDVNSALASGNRDTMLTLASQIDRDNNLGCPLN